MRVWALFVDHPTAAYEHAGEGEESGNKSQDAPKRLSEPAEPAEMHLGQPKEDPVEELITGIKEPEHRVKGLWECKIGPGNSPHQNEEEGPRPERAVDVPSEPRKVRPPIHAEAEAPALDSRPPYDRSRQTEQRHTHGAKPVDKAADAPGQEVGVKIHEPFDGELRLQFIAVNDDTAGYTHQYNVEGDNSPDQIVNLKKESVQPQVLWMFQPSLPPPHMPLHLVSPASDGRPILPARHRNSKSEWPQHQRGPLPFGEVVVHHSHCLHMGVNDTWNPWKLNPRPFSLCSGHQIP
jgi:hypothetical protein